MCAPNIANPFERFLRFALGLYAVVLGVLFVQGTVGIVMAALGGFAALTGLSGRCPLYAWRARGCAVPSSAEIPTPTDESQQTPPAV